MGRPLLAGLVALGALLVSAATAAAHGDELRDMPRPVQADFVPPAPGTYTLHRIMRAPTGSVIGSDGRRHRLGDVTTGKVTLLAFVYTACTDAWGCPLA